MNRHITTRLEYIAQMHQGGESLEQIFVLPIKLCKLDFFWPFGSYISIFCSRDCYQGSLDRLEEKAFGILFNDNFQDSQEIIHARNVAA